MVHRCRHTIHSGWPRLSRTDGVYSIRCCPFEAMVAGAGTRPTNERVGRVIVLEEYPVLNPAKRHHNPLQPRNEAKGGGIKGSGSVILSLRRIWFFKFIRRLGHRARRVSGVEPGKASPQPPPAEERGEGRGNQREWVCHPELAKDLVF